MSARDRDLAARAADLARREADAQPAARRTVGTPRSAPVRITTDLSPLPYRELVAFAAELAQELGVARVTHSDVIRSLVEMLQDPAIAAQVSESVATRFSR